MIVYVPLWLHESYTVFDLLKIRQTVTKIGVVDCEVGRTIL